MGATGTILRSLDDDSFNGERSEAVLERVAARSVLDFGPWHPEQVSGTSVPMPIGMALHQRREGDCVGISVLKAFSTTGAGAAILDQIVKSKPDGFIVDLPGAPGQAFRLGAGDLDQYGIGDPAAAAIIDAMVRYFGLDPHRSALPTNKVMELVAGHLGRHRRLADHATDARELIGFLMAEAPHVGVDTAMVFGGRPARDGDWTSGNGHAFAAIRINAPTRTLIYTNHWNERREHRIPIDELARQAAGTTADFETVTFAPGGG